MYFDTQTVGGAQFAKRYQPRTSGGTKVRLPSDRMSQKQWEERCGKVVTYQLNEPKTWEEFKQMPPDIQKQYIEVLQKRFDVNASSLAKMFGVLPLTVRRHIAAKNLGVVFPVGKSMSGGQKALWDAFIGLTDEAPEEERQEPEQQRTDVNQTDEEAKAPNGMVMKSIRMVFDGEISVHGIANSLRVILGENPVGQVEIVCELR